MDYGRLTLDEIKKGYRFDKDVDGFICNYCDKSFKIGQVFSFDDKFYDPEHAVVKHNEVEHGGNFMQLVNENTKYNTLTENQKELLTLFDANIPDAEIAKKLGVSASTVRHQKFTFREKAKQAKHYLAVFENVFDEQKTNSESIVSIHNNAIYYDDRYVITEKEKSHVLETFFESLNPRRLKNFSVKEKNKVVILTQIVKQFEVGEKYTEKEVNQILKSIYHDYSTIRRYLIMYGFMDRATDGSSYWLAK